MPLYGQTFHPYSTIEQGGFTDGNQMEEYKAVENYFVTSNSVQYSRPCVEILDAPCVSNCTSLRAYTKKVDVFWTVNLKKLLPEIQVEFL